MALATPVGVSGIAVIRVSGAQSVGIYQKLTHRDQNPPARVAQFLTAYTQSGKKIDDTVITFFKGPQSFTGEDVIEISPHGNPYIISEIISSCQSHGARLAMPGEFTFRAFTNGKIDLVQAEGVLTLIESKGAAAKDEALKQLQGALSKEVVSVYTEIERVLAHLEASIDFSTENLDISSTQLIFKKLSSVIDRLTELLANAGGGQLLKDGVRVALVGSPNAGKSSLLNSILGSDRAIVSPTPGTTRDTIEAETIVDGIRVVWIDTAGIHETPDEIEKIGIGKSLQEAQVADLVLYIQDAFNKNLQKAHFSFPSDAQIVNVYTKLDLLNSKPDADMNNVWIDSRTPEGARAVLDLVKFHLSKFFKGDQNFVMVHRQRELLMKALKSVQASLGDLNLLGNQPELVSVGLYEAHRALAELLGKSVGEDVIDRIFKEFCLGK